MFHNAHQTDHNLKINRQQWCAYVAFEHHDTVQSSYTRIHYQLIELSL